LLAFAWDLSFGKTKEPTMENTSAPHGKQPPHGKHLGHTWKITGGHGKQRGAREKQGPPLETFTKCKCLSSKTFLDTFTQVLHTAVLNTFTHVLHTERGRGIFSTHALILVDTFTHGGILPQSGARVSKHV